MKMYLFFLLLVIGSCVALKPMKMKRAENLSEKFRLDGYYVQCSNEGNGYYRQVKIFYRNGVMINFDGKFEQNCIAETNRYLQRNDLNLTSVPYWLGIYQVIRNDSLVLESWYSTDYYYPTIQSAGKILNDTTLLIEYPKYPIDTFRFVEFSPKPDSTNKFIK